MKKQISADRIRSVKCDVEEQETIYQYSRDSSKVSMYTSDNTVLTKMKRLMTAYPDIFIGYSEAKEGIDPTGYFFEFPKKLMSLRKPSAASNRKKELSDEQKVALKERLKAGRLKKQ